VRPRMARLKQGYRFWCVLLTATCVIIPSLLIGFLFFEWRASPSKQTMNSDLWRTMPFIVLPLIFLLIAFCISIAHKRLVTQGELSIGKVTNVRFRRRCPEVTYEFVDRSGRLITASSPDNTRSFSPGMAIPIFYNTESPETDQVALCGSVYEIAD
jgi:hypothetical protein